MNSNNQRLPILKNTTLVGVCPVHKKKRKLMGLKVLEVLKLKLNFSPEVKYLRITLDRKLLWID